MFIVYTYVVTEPRVNSSCGLSPVLSEPFIRSQILDYRTVDVLPPPPPLPPFRSMEFPRSEDLLEDRVSHELDTLLVTMRLERSCADTINCNGGFDERIKLRKGDGI